MGEVDFVDAEVAVSTSAVGDVDSVLFCDFFSLNANHEPITPKKVSKGFAFWSGKFSGKRCSEAGFYFHLVCGPIHTDSTHRLEISKYPKSESCQLVSATSDKFLWHKHTHSFGKRKVIGGRKNSLESKRDRLFKFKIDKKNLIM